MLCFIDHLLVVNVSLHDSQRAIFIFLKHLLLGMFFFVPFEIKPNSMTKQKLTTVINKLVNIRNTRALVPKQAVTMICVATFSLISKIEQHSQAALQSSFYKNVF